MIRLGKINKLKIVKKVKFGVYLSDNEKYLNDIVLLPNKYVPVNCKIGDEIEVFVYCDSEDRCIATTKKSYIMCGQLARLVVVEVSKIGAFLDWGLEKDLFLPFKEQTVKVKVGNSYLVKLYVDKSNRLCASMKVYNDLCTNHSYKIGDKVNGIIYDKVEGIGYFVAIDYKFSALIPKREAYGELYIGKIIEARIVYIKNDGKIDLSVRKKITQQINDDANRILAILKKNNNHLGFNERSDVITIAEKTGLSKSAFKRAVGRLLKQNKIKIVVGDIQLIEYNK